MAGTESIAETTGLDGAATEARALALHLTQAEQQERERIASVLHDDVQHLLFSLQRHLISLQQGVGELGPRGASILEQMKQATEEAIATTRSLTTQLSPPVLKERNLHFFFKWLALHFRTLYELEVRLDLQSPFQLDDDDLRTLIYITVQELLMNVVRHAGVDCADVKVAAGQGQLRMCIEDEGTGFDPAAPTDRGGGLRRVRERIMLMEGSLLVRATPGEGTCVEVVLPL